VVLRALRQEFREPPPLTPTHPQQSSGVSTCAQGANLLPSVAYALHHFFTEV
jgi:hypothetical protein